jgi:hypothetical protein
MSSNRSRRLVAYAGFAVVFGLLGFMTAFVVFHRQDSNEEKRFLDHFGFLPQGKLRPGKYLIPTTASEAMILEIRGDSNSGFAASLSFDNGQEPRGCNFQYMVNSDYGVPMATLITGRLGELHLWYDVGLRGRLSIEHTEGSPSRLLLGNEWVTAWSVSKGVVTYKDKKYRYDEGRDGFVEFEDATRP